MIQAKPSQQRRMYSLNREYAPPLTAPPVVPTSEISDLNSLDEFGPDKRGHKGTERKCAATGKVEDTAKMIRFVLSPDGVVTPDIMGKLPGRGVWVTAHREHMSKAIKMGAFSRGFKTKTKVDECLTELTEHLLSRRLLGLLAMARKSGHIAIGYDQVKSAAGSGKIAWRIEAREGAADGRGKIRTLAKAVALELDMPVPKVIGCFTGQELAHALGRDTVIHVSLPPGKLAKAFTADAVRYRGFRQLVPREWEDIGHEIKMPKADDKSVHTESGKRP